MTIKRKMAIAAALLSMTFPLQAEEPPMTLPKEFLMQLPLLMNLSDQEFEGLLNTIQRKSEKPESGKKISKEKRNDEN